MIDLDELRAELDEFAQPEKKGGRSPREERIIAGFEEIQKFVEQYGHAPRHGEDKDVFERLYAVRLERLRALEESRALLLPLDHQGLLTGAEVVQAEPVETMDDDELLAELEGLVGSSGITELRHVRTSAEKRVAEEISNRTACEDFNQFKPLFEKVKREVKSGMRQTRSFHTKAMDEIQRGTFFIVGGQIAYVAEVGEEFTTQYERRDSRLRVIYDNGTESNVLQRSLQRALHRDAAARFITDPSAGPLFSETFETDDIESGTIYVLRSMSTHPFISEHRELIHKIGVTGGHVESRIAKASLDATYLLAAVEVVATYKLAGINRGKLENLFHRLFAPAQLDLTIHDRFGHPVRPREWFLVPLHVIDEAVQRIREGSISSMSYDPKTAKLVG
ncbi:MAG: GIY-YIG nuclease family protein [Deltaproteobacteria bacterium]|nr:GIY-YIG nuclease family protein [Deltaproteobacteria bacterium]TLN01508.1 MAG: GIY-YIG nuclease family protein [bacterium]